MARRHHPPSGELPRVFVGSQAVAAGVLTPRQLRGPAVERVVHGVYRPRWVPDSHSLRCEAVGLVLHGSFALTGRSAATVLGATLARAEDPVEVLVPHSQRVTVAEGITVHRVTKFPPAGDRWRGVPVVPRERMALDLVRGQSLPSAVAHLDVVCRAGLLDAGAFADWLVSTHGDGVVVAREAVRLVDVRSESPPESVVRVELRRAGIEVEPQHVVRCRGAFVARVDLAVVEARVAIEYDGAWHALREQLEADRCRLNALHAAGWVVVHVTAQQLRRPEEVVDAVRRATTLRTGNWDPT